MLDVIRTTRGCCHASYQCPTWQPRLTSNSSTAFLVRGDGIYCTFIEYKIIEIWSHTCHQWVCPPSRGSSGRRNFSFLYLCLNGQPQACKHQLLRRKRDRHCVCRIFWTLFQSMKCTMKTTRDSCMWRFLVVKDNVETIPLCRADTHRTDIYRLKAHLTAVQFLRTSLRCGFYQQHTSWL